MERWVLACALLCGGASLAGAQAQRLDPEEPAFDGPTLGHVDQTEAWLWLRAPGVREVEAQVTPSGGEAERRRLPFAALGRGFGRLRLSGLRPDTAYQVAVRVGEAEPVQLSFRTAPPPREWGKLRFAVGSCAREDAQPVWKVVLEERPELFVFLGDHVYYGRRAAGGNDWDSVPNMIAKQMSQRRRPSLLRVLQTTPSYAVWDDHDYGPNNSSRRFPLRAESRLVHRYLWSANPGFGQDGEGVHFSFRRGPVEFFLLDDRSFKEVGVPLAERTIYGAKQLEWLRRGLTRSTAPLKVVGSGTQVLLGYPLAEGWQQAPAEKKRFLEWARGADLGPVLFLSGDIHVSELYRVPHDKAKPKGSAFWELTASGLATDAFGYQDLFKAAVREERRWIESRRNVCMVEVDVPRDPAKRAEATLRFTCLAAKDGEVLKDTRATFASFGSASGGASPAEPPKKKFFQRGR